MEEESLQHVEDQEARQDATSASNHKDSKQQKKTFGCIIYGIVAILGIVALIWSEFYKSKKLYEMAEQGLSGTFFGNHPFLSVVSSSFIGIITLIIVSFFVNKNKKKRR